MDGRDDQGRIKIDVELLRSYGLPQAATDALETLALWQIRHLLDGGMRLRTNCDLELASSITPVRGPRLPTADVLNNKLREQIKKAGEVEGEDKPFGDGKAITVAWQKKGVREKKGKD